MELAASRTGQFGNPAFDRRVDVLVTVDEDERARLHLDPDLIECRKDVVTLIVGQQTNAAEAAHVNFGPNDVVTPHALVVREADRIRQQCFRRPAGEAAVPEGFCLRRQAAVARKFMFVIKIHGSSSSGNSSELAKVVGKRSAIEICSDAHQRVIASNGSQHALDAAPIER